MAHNEIVNLCYKKALRVLSQNSHPKGFLASSSNPHYASIWSRDACITTIGANLTGMTRLIETSKNTLRTLSRLQSPMGQIPAVYWPQREYWDWGEVGATDASAWFVIASWHYYKTTGEKTFLKELRPSLQAAFTWFRSQDASNFGLIDSPEAADWMDSTLNRSGKVMYVNTLYHWASQAMNEMVRELGDNIPHIDINSIKFKFNLLFWPSLNSNYGDLLRHVKYPRNTRLTFPHPCSTSAFTKEAKQRCFYLSHISYGRFVDVCDVLGNSLAILTDLASDSQKNQILGYFREKEVSLPYPAKSLAEPIIQTQDYWGILKSNVEEFQSPQWRNPPYCYHNAGIWPFIGGFYVLALLKCGEKELAETEVMRLAESNRLGAKNEWEFPEWINAKTGEPEGASYQSWNAATYVMAYKAVRGELPTLLTPI